MAPLHRSLFWFGAALVSLVFARVIDRVPDEPLEESLPEVLVDPHESGCFQRSEGEGALQVTWAEVEKSPHCFFFSGPEGLGRDDPLGDVAAWSSGEDWQSFAFGEAGFGSVDGDYDTLLRESLHEYAGHAWRATETIQGAWGKTTTEDRRTCDVFEGRYRYEECDLEDPSNCRSPCIIEAKVIAR